MFVPVARTFGYSIGKVMPDTLGCEYTEKYRVPFFIAHCLTTKQVLDMNNTSIGSLIKAELERQERSVVWLARHLCCDRTNIYRIFAKESIDTELLMRISIVLNHNFFKDISSAIDEQLLQK